MRAHQLCNMARSILGDRYDFSLTGMPGPDIPGLQRAWVAAQPRGAIYFVTKAATRGLAVDNARRLQARAGGVCFDHVDSDPNKIARTGADIHLCASYAQFDALTRLAAADPTLTGTPMLLLHTCDERLFGFAPVDLPELRVVYFGNPVNAHTPEHVGARLDVVDASSVDRMARTIDRLHDYNLHYCVRPPQSQGANLQKPFTKGFTAAAVGANVIVNRQTDDAIAFLGDDYPYLTDGLDTGEILATLDKATRDFGGADWQRARAVMDSVAARVSPLAICGQIEAIINELGASRR